MSRQGLIDLVYDNPVLLGLLVIAYRLESKRLSVLMIRDQLTMKIGGA